MSHQELLRGKEETLLRIIHPNVLLLALLAEYNLDEFTEQAIRACNVDFKRNRHLLDWLKDSPPEAFDGFLRALRANGQCHVANYIDGTPGEIPLCDQARERLRRIKGYVIQHLDASNGMLAYLYEKSVIGDTDYSILLGETLKDNRNAMLMDIIVRGSDRGFACFCDCLQSDKNQEHLVRCLLTGEILSMHVTIQPGDCEDNIISQLKKLIARKEKLMEELTNEERNTVKDLLQQLQAVVVDVQITNSLMLFAHLMSPEVLDAVCKMYGSGQLTVIIRDLFRCLAKDKDLSVELTISEESFKLCEDGFAEDGSFCIDISRFARSSSGVETESEDTESDYLWKLRSELHRTRAQVNELSAQCRKHEANWMSIDEHLSMIEKDSAARSDASMEALEKARQCVRESLELQTKVYRMQNIGTWLLSSEFQSASDFVDIPYAVDVRSEIDAVTDIGDDSASVCAQTDSGYGSVASRQPGTLTQPLSEQYTMTSKRRGLFIIISNEHFLPESRMNRRVGSDRDIAMLREVFSRLGFDIQIYKDLNAKDIVEVFKRAGRMDHSHYDCFALAVMTHGDADDVLLDISGKAFNLDSLMEHMKSCKSLVGKPKICLIQASRGSHLDQGIGFDDAEERESSIPQEADQLILHSTSEGYYSWRNSAKGSWFIQALVDELHKALALSTAESVDFAKVVTNVNHAVAYNMRSVAATTSTNNMKQMPSIYSTLTKEIHFPRPEN